MGIKLQLVEWENMFGYGEGPNQLVLDSDPITQLTAPNGHGKTSIVLIIQEILFSKNVKNIKKTDIKNRHIKETFWSGSVKFIDTDTLKEYCVSVVRKNNVSKVAFTEDGIDISEHKIPDTYKKVKSILGDDFEIFSQLTYQSSKDLLQFINATDTNRKKFLINLFNLEKYINIGETLKLKIQQTEREEIRISGELDGVIKFLDSTKVPEELELEDVPSITPGLDVKIGELTNQILDFETKCKKIDKNNLYITEQQSLVFDMTLTEPDNQVITNIQNQINTQNSSISVEANRISEFKKQMTSLDLSDSCYACGQSIDNTVSLEIKYNLEEKLKTSEHAKSTIESALKGLKDAHTRLLEMKSKYSANKNKIEKFEQLAQLITEDLARKHPDYNELINKKTNLTSKLYNETSKREMVIKNNEEVKIHNASVQTLHLQKREFLVKKELLETDIRAIIKRISILTILRKAFSPSGIVAFKLENLTKELEDTINEYLATVSDGQFQIIFRLTGEKLNIVVLDYGLECAIETVSGGEFSRIQTSILLAIRSMLSKMGGNAINLLFLDEITGVLDAEGREVLMDILLQERDLNVFLISHDLEHPLIKKINITKEDKISKIEIE